MLWDKIREILIKNREKLFRDNELNIDIAIDLVKKEITGK